MTQNILDRILHFILLIPMIKFHNISEILISPSLISIDDVVTTIELDPHHVIYTIKCEKTKIIRFSIQLTDTLIIRLPCFFIDFMFFHSKTHCSWNELDLYRDFDLSTFRTRSSTCSGPTPIESSRRPLPLTAAPPGERVHLPCSRPASSG